MNAVNLKRLEWHSSVDGVESGLKGELMMVVDGGLVSGVMVDWGVG